ncbi:hypothetical protein ANCDUO_22041, partial [Ancylostoma duodenale]
MLSLTNLTPSTIVESLGWITGPSFLGFSGVARFLAASTTPPKGEFLSAENSNYNIICAIGPQGAGKSTILSMIGGNNSQDMYRQYIFRPASREALESSRHQTTKIHAYITKSKQIFLDCQAANCASVLDESLRYSRSPLTDGRYAINNYIE